MSDFKLTLDPTPDIIDVEGTPVPDATDANNLQPAETAVGICELLENDLTTAQQEEIARFVPQITLVSEVVDTYGVGAQDALNQQTKKITSITKAQDLGAVGVSLATLVRSLKDNDPSNVPFPVEPQENEFQGFFDKITNAYGKAMAAFKEKYREALDAAAAKHSTAEELIEQAAKELNNHAITLGCDIKTFESLEDALKDYMIKLTMFILAGKRRLELFRQDELPKLQAAAQSAGPTSNAAQELADAVDNANYFDKQIHNLLLSREIGAQALIMSRLIRNNARSLRQQIIATINHAIPTWRTQMTLLLGVQNSKAALAAQTEATNFTNAKMQELATQLGQATVEIAQASERGIIDIKTLETTHQTLVDTVGQILDIQANGAAQRKSAEATLAGFEIETRAKYKELLARKATF